jgi:hypothetical protein
MSTFGKADMAAPPGQTERLYATSQSLRSTIVYLVFNPPSKITQSDLSASPMKQEVRSVFYGSPNLGAAQIFMKLPHTSASHQIVLSRDNSQGLDLDLRRSTYRRVTHRNHTGQQFGADGLHNHRIA